MLALLLNLVVIWTASPSNAAVTERSPASSAWNHCAWLLGISGSTFACSSELDDWSLLQLRATANDVGVLRRSILPWWEDRGERRSEDPWWQDRSERRSVIPWWEVREASPMQHMPGLSRPYLLLRNTSSASHTFLHMSSTTNSSNITLTNTGYYVRWSLAVNGIAITLCALIFLIGTCACAKVYNGNAPAMDGTRAGNCCDCATRSCTLSIDEVAHLSGLDQAMLMKYTWVSIEILLVISIPILIIAIAMNAAGVHIWSISLSLFLKDGSNSVTLTEEQELGIYWTYAALVWIVSVIAQLFIRRAQRQFVPLWMQWMKSVQGQQGATVMVTNVPPSHRTDAALRKYFNNLLRRDAVRTANIVKKTTELLLPLWYQLKISERELDRSQHTLEKTGMRPQVKSYGVSTQSDAITHHEEEVTQIKKLVFLQRQHIMNESKAEYPRNLEVNSSNAFVTFRKVNDANAVLSLPLHNPSVQVPPDPYDVHFDNLAEAPRKAFRMQNIGCLILGCLSVVFLLVIVCIGLTAASAVIETVSPHFKEVVEETPLIAAIWNSCLGVTLICLLLHLSHYLSFHIIEQMFYLPSTVNEQQAQQTLTLVVQVLSLCGFAAAWWFIPDLLRRLLDGPEADKTFMSPRLVAELFKTRFQESSYIFVCYLITRWAFHFLDLTRYWQLLKYVFYWCWYGDTQVAKGLCEPENPGTHGIGARSASFTTTLIFTLCYCTVNPIVIVFGMIDFGLCRVIYGYLTTFAERHKPDSGGSFYVAQLKHTQYGLFLYVVVMSTFLFIAASNIGPGLLTIAALIPWAYFSFTFERQFNQAGSPADLTLHDADLPKHAFDIRAYIQPEICEPLGLPGPGTKRMPSTSSFLSF